MMLLLCLKKKNYQKVEKYNECNITSVTKIINKIFDFCKRC